MHRMVLLSHPEIPVGESKDNLPLHIMLLATQLYSVQSACEARVLPVRRWDKTRGGVHPDWSPLNHRADALRQTTSLEAGNTEREALKQQTKKAQGTSLFAFDIFWSKCHYEC